LQLSSLLSSSPFFLSRLKRALVAGVWSSSFLGKGKREGDKHLIFWEREGDKSMQLVFGEGVPPALSLLAAFIPLLKARKKKGCLDVGPRLS